MDVEDVVGGSSEHWLFMDGLEGCASGEYADRSAGLPSRGSGEAKISGLSGRGAGRRLKVGIRNICQRKNAPG